MKKTVQVIMLPTTNPHQTILFQSKLSKTIGIAIRRNMIDDCIITVDCSPKFNLPVSDVTPQHLYFTSNEEIEEGDWFVTPQKELFKAGLNGFKNIFPFPVDTKVIATTDKSLGLSIIPQSFFEEYVRKNGEIKEVQYEGDIESGLWLYIHAIRSTKYQTVEEAAEEKYKNSSYPMNAYLEEAFIAGAKWQKDNPNS